MPKRQVLAALGFFVGGAVMGAAGLALGYLWATGDAAAPSQAIIAPTLAVGQATTGLEQFQIVSGESEVRFVLDELDPPVQGLTGRTDQVAATLWLDPVDPRNTRLGPIRINMRTLATGHRARDTALRERILMSAQEAYEFTDFVPTAVYGLPESVAVGDTFTFWVVGDLRLVEVTHSLLFQMNVQVIAADRISGSGYTVVYRDDLGLLQSFLGERGVSNAIRLEIDFVAERVAGQG